MGKWGILWIVFVVWHILCTIRLDSKFIIISVAAAPQIPPAQTQKAPAPPPPSGPRYVAVYDYTAADDDEISFQEGMSLPFLFSSSFPLFPAPTYTMYFTSSFLL